MGKVDEYSGNSRENRRRRRRRAKRRKEMRKTDASDGTRNKKVVK